MAGMRMIETPFGPAGVDLDRPDGVSRGTLALGHGAGGGVTAPDLVAVRDAAVAAGFTVARVTQPYRVAGRRAPAPATQLDTAWLAVLAEVGGGPLVVGGRSSGARVACRTATAAGAVAVLALAFPVHPPGKPEKSRLAELDTGLPTLVVNGDRDPFGLPPEAPGREVVVIPGAVHDLRKDLEAVAQAVTGWLARR
ncbi:alpha/beta hydrolase family protein [Virgisporangium aliadipatigenens]|uniref:alpha/beta hydrolase family protein n=1 Tax=Virgisporangium aliadipatigenens TaxID=741659 RepID=UPI00357123E6